MTQFTISEEQAIKIFYNNFKARVRRACHNDINIKKLLETIEENSSKFYNYIEDELFYDDKGNFSNKKLNDMIYFVDNYFDILEKEQLKLKKLDRSLFKRPWKIKEQTYYILDLEKQYKKYIKPIKRYKDFIEYWHDEQGNYIDINKEPTEKLIKLYKKRMEEVFNDTIEKDKSVLLIKCDEDEDAKENKYILDFIKQKQNNYNMDKIKKDFHEDFTKRQMSFRPNEERCF